jgi:diguanylate cyclase (GGDEF)-like protein
MSSSPIENFSSGGASLNSQPLRLLLLEDKSFDGLLFNDLLMQHAPHQFQVVHVASLREALEQVRATPFDLIVTDLNVTDSHGLNTFISIKQSAPDLPIIVLSGLDNREIALMSVQAGGQDYLVKGQFEGAALVRSIYYAIERNRMQNELWQLSLTDALTGLFNRRGFLLLAREQFKLAQRSNKAFVLFFCDMDGLKQINDNFGHLEGDRALVETAHILRDSFRDSDILSRWGGDEFCALAVQATTDGADLISTRLRHKLEQHNSEHGRPYRLALTVGFSHLNSKTSKSLEEVLDQADRNMYEKKRLDKTLMPFDRVAQLSV